jgi:rod shape-determining protein MreC
MNKKFFYFIIAIIMAISFYFKDYIINSILDTFNSVKTEIIISYDVIRLKFNSYFHQAEQIETLQKHNKIYRDYIESIYPLISNYKKMEKFQLVKTPKIVFTKTISYANLPDMTSIYVDYSDKNFTHPKGLIYNKEVAGIVTKNYKDYSLALLNTNPNTTYTIFIGKDKIPGIAFGGEKLVIKYIPKYKNINIGDLVITSGLDRIFYEGVKVGKIISINQRELYQEAVVKPFYNPYHPTFFYVVNKK